MNITIMFLLVALIYILMGVHTLSQDVNDSRNRVYFVITFMFAFWGIINATMFLITDANIAAEARKNMVFSWGVVYSVIIHFTLLLSKPKPKKTSLLHYMILYIPALINVCLYFFDPYMANELKLTDKGWFIESYYRTSVLWNYYFYFYYVLSVLASLIILLRWNKRTSITREKKQSMLIVITIVIAFILGSIFEIILPLVGVSIVYGVTIIITLIPVAGMAYAIEKFGLMSFKPENLTIEVMKHMNEGIILCDDKGEIISFNYGAQRILSCVSVHEPHYIESIMGTSLLTQEPYYGEGVFNNCEGLKIPVLFSCIPLYDTVSELCGYLIVFQDITKLVNVQKELIALNDNLEETVRIRTEELKEINEDLLIEIKEHNIAEEKIRQLAYYDYLTNLPNPRQFYLEMERRIADYSMTNQAFAIVYIDLDNFKSINDTLGHSKGDELLKLVANRFLMIQGDDSFICRNGGDEFLFLLNYDQDPTNRQLKKEINHILGVFSSLFLIEGQELHITGSIGVSLFPLHGTSQEELIKFADIAMYQAKAAIKSSFVIFDDVMMQGIQRELKITNDLYKAIQNNEFELYYQSQWDSAQKHIIGVEALIRWRHPQMGIIPPNEFIPVAEKSGLIIEIGDWVVSEAFRQQKKWKNLYQWDINVSINLSIRQIQYHAFIESVIDHAKKFDTDMNRIEFEVTESVVMDRTEQCIEILNKLVQLGARISVDDFGVAYSSFMHIKSLPIDKIKIDKCFVDGIGIDKKDEAIIKTIIALSKNLDYEVVAEGIETVEQMNFLVDNGCVLHQGYYYSKPLQEALLIQYIQNSNVKRDK